MIDFFKKNKQKSNTNYVNITWPTHVESLNKKTFDSFVEMYPLSVIDFWAPWCSPCKTMLPRLRRLERLYQGSVAFGRVNTQDEKDIAKQYNIMGIPHFGFFHYGKKVGSVTGIKSIGDMKDSIESYLQKYNK